MMKTVVAKIKAFAAHSGEKQGSWLSSGSQEPANLCLDVTVALGSKK